jgi:hypothetical protein
MEADHERDDDEPRGGGTQWRVGSVDVAGWRAAMGAVEGGTLTFKPQVVLSSKPCSHTTC